jgi:NAD(P)-dependent dehydrogenase (short-subunit alcohol dehydrogenase family)
MSRLKGKVAIITGAGAGIGRASMERFAEEGALVVGIGRTYEKLEQTKAQLQDKGLKCHIVGGDVSIWEGASEAFNAAFKVHGRVDVLLNSAGVGYSWAKVSVHADVDMHHLTMGLDLCEEVAPNSPKGQLYHRTLWQSATLYHQMLCSWVGERVEPIKLLA